MWARESDRHLLLWKGDGIGYTPVPIGNHAAGWEVVDAADFDADGRSDLLMRNAEFGLSAYWLMNGAVVSGYSAAFTNPLQYRRVALGDFNGDGRMDILWARHSDRRLLLWQNNGSGFTQLDIGGYAPGWVVGDVGDIDADGKSDLVMRNAALGWTAYWVMNGAAVTRYSGLFDEPVGFQPVSSGDFNGDGRMDLVWAREGDRSLLLWQGDGTGFSQQPIRTYGDGWRVQSGVAPNVVSSYRRGDVDGDGRGDLSLQNADLGANAYWVMNGATVSRYSSLLSAPAGYTRVATGDFNRDDILDIVWDRASDGQLLMWLGDGVGYKALPIRTHAAGWAVVGAGDIDGDGMGDLVWSNAATGGVAYWTMDAATPVRYSPIFVPPSGHALVALGDFNADGLLDLTWDRASDGHLLQWQGNGSGFFAQAIATQHATTYRIAGAGDFDGDGNSDLLLVNDADRKVGYWKMIGATPTNLDSVPVVQPAGYALTALGDYNGDGRMDLAWERGADGHVLFWLGSGSNNSFAAAPVGTHASGWQIVRP